MFLPGPRVTESSGLPTDVLRVLSRQFDEEYPPEKRNGEWELCAQDELWIERKRCPEFGDGRVVAILLQGVIAASKMGFRGISRSLGWRDRLS